ncbi:gas vesicle protein GvpJ [Paenibacillus silvisoli]|uniref:gas vesicle protein GvpJ n=1 Tax=Paenibacillus silvisoli TaxID=3110539 RepID=UPI0028058474|nr:gas vesicle protein GvpJ [Paenibacillus silvisoli]
MRDWYANKEITLLDILDSLLDTGVVVRGELILSIANIDLVYIDLRLLVTAIESIVRYPD